MLGKLRYTAFTCFVAVGPFVDATFSAPIAQVVLGNGSGAGNSEVAIPVSIMIDPSSSPIDGITLNFSGSDKALELISFTKASAVSEWTDLDSFDPADGIVSVGTFGQGLLGGTVRLGTLVVKASGSGEHVVRLDGGQGAATAILSGTTMMNPSVQAGTVTTSGGNDSSSTSQPETPSQPASESDPPPSDSAEDQPDPGSEKDSAEPSAPSSSSGEETKLVQDEDSVERKPAKALSFCGSGLLGTLPGLFFGLSAFKVAQNRRKFR